MDIKAYLEKTYPSSDLTPPESFLDTRFHLRFELGDGFENGTVERIDQCVSRASTLFEEFFLPSDEVWILVNSCKYHSEHIVDFFHPTPGYLEKQFKSFDSTEKTIYQETIEEKAEALNENDELVMTDFTRTHFQTFFTHKVSDIHYRDIFRGIANLEMGFDPSIARSTYFINTRNHVAFFMYDDRGCKLFSSKRKTLQPTYQKFNEWLVDYHRETFDNIYL